MVHKRRSPAKRETDTASSSSGGDSVPVPDPTRLTTELVDRALGAKMDIIETRFDGHDRATEVQALAVRELASRSEVGLDKAAADVGRQLMAMREYFLERIAHAQDVAALETAALRAMIVERDARIKQAAAEAKTSLDAALTAQSAIAAQQNTANAIASNKQEVAFQKLLDQQAATSAASIKALQDQVADLKDRLGRTETQAATALSAANTRTEVRTEAKTDNRASQTATMAVIGLVLTIVIFLASKFGGS